MKLYHGTDTESAEAINNDGHIKAGHSYYGGISGVALTPRFDVAVDFALSEGGDGVVFEVDVDENHLVADPESENSESVDDVLNSGGSVYACLETVTPSAQYAV